MFPQLSCSVIGQLCGTVRWTLGIRCCSMHGTVLRFFPFSYIQLCGI